MEFDIRLTPESRAKIDALEKAGKIDLRPIMNTIGVSYRKEVELIFQKQQPRGEDQRWGGIVTGKQIGRAHV